MSTQHYPKPRTLAAALAALALVLLAVVSPDSTRVAAASPFVQEGAVRDALVAGHRGDERAPENTLPAFRLALSSSAEFIETDLQLTSDGVPVLMHDWTLERTTNGAGPVWNRTWEQVQALDAGSWFSPEFAGTRVPSLDELLDLVQPTAKRVILELKGSWTASQVAPVAAAIYARGLEQRVILASFDIMSLAAVGTVADDLQRLVISRKVTGDPAILAGTCGAIGIVTSRAFLESDPDAVARIHEAGLGVMAYTLNSEDSWSEAIALGVDGIITDKPRAFEGWLASSGG
jgi:glycerophosphoryl diester phosphodiesterase